MEGQSTGRSLIRRFRADGVQADQGVEDGRKAVNGDHNPTFSSATASIVIVVIIVGQVSVIVGVINIVRCIVIIVYVVIVIIIVIPEVVVVPVPNQRKAVRPR